MAWKPPGPRGHASGAWRSRNGSMPAAPNHHSTPAARQNGHHRADHVAKPGPPAVVPSFPSGAAPNPARRGDARRRRRPQRAEVVAALQEAPSTRPGGTSAASRAVERGEVAGGQAQPGDGVGPVGVEAGRQQQPGRLELARQRPDHVVDGGQVAVAGGAGRQRHVDRAGRRRGRSTELGQRRCRGRAATGGGTRRRTRSSAQNTSWVPLPWWAS